MRRGRTATPSAASLGCMFPQPLPTRSGDALSPNICIGFFHRDRKSPARKATRHSRLRFSQKSRPRPRPSTKRFAVQINCPHYIRPHHCFKEEREDLQETIPLGARWLSGFLYRAPHDQGQRLEQRENHTEG